MLFISLLRHHLLRKVFPDHADKILPFLIYFNLSLHSKKLQKGSECFAVSFSAVCLGPRLAPGAEKGPENYLSRE